jgi:transcriptional regulator with XRE-family HTH domain
LISKHIIPFEKTREHTMKPNSDALHDLGSLLHDARKKAGLTQEQVAERAGISRPSYREIENGGAAARATTLINVARALGLELMLIPQAMVPGVQALLRPSDDDDRPAFTTEPDDGDHAYSPRP